MADQLSPPSEEDAWHLTDHGYQPALEHEIESRFALANGLVGLRASLDTPTSASRPRTFIAGVFDTADGQTVPSLVALPDWLRYRLTVDGVEVTAEPRTREFKEHRRTLDLRDGSLYSRLTVHFDSGLQVSIVSLRFAALHRRDLAAELVAVHASDCCRLELECELDDSGTGFEFARDPATRTAVIAGGFSLTACAMALRSSLAVGGTPIEPSAIEPRRVRWTWTAGPGAADTLSLVAGFARRPTTSQATAVAKDAVRRAPRSVPALYQHHLQVWRRRWAEADVEVDGDPPAQRALRFAIYHLVSVANPTDERTSIGARALTGDAYLGHVFWDTEIFLLPFYTLTWPAAARALLMYRYHTLPAARAKARAQGFRGALYAWESAATGDEVTPRFALGPNQRVISIHCGSDEQHISADVAYAVWQYWQATRDHAYLRDAGAEILLETSRFWASRARLEPDGQYHIRHVIGPDEYHDQIDDNAYTNVMAAFNIECGLHALDELRRRWPDRADALTRELNLAADELTQWRDVCERMKTGLDTETGLFEQFEGFFSLEKIDLRQYAARTAPLDVVLGTERTAHAQVLKQADVVMLLDLLGDRYGRAIEAANFHYYEPRTAYGSSLSPSAYAVAAARLGETDLAKRLFDETASIDLNDSFGNAAGGVHIGSLGGLWQAAVFGFAGLRMSASGLRFDPHPPARWRSLAFRIHWRGRRVRVQVTSDPDALLLTLECGRPMTVRVGEIPVPLARGSISRCVREETGQWREQSDGL